MHKVLSSTLLLISTLCPVMAFGQAIDLAKAVGELTDRLVALSKGEVVGVEGETLYLSLGQKDGILEGNTFEVVRLGEQLKGGMRKETIVGEVAITRVREQGSIAKVTHKSEEIKEGDQVYQLRKQVARVAVTEFPFGDNKFNVLTRNVQDILYTTLIQKGLTVVEREKLEEVLREQKAGTTGVIDLSTAAQMGKLLGVEAVVVGSMSDLGNSIAIIGRLVDAEKGVALSAARVELAKTPMLADLAKTDIRATRLGSPGVAPEPSKGEKGSSGTAGSSLPKVKDGNMAELREDQPEWVINGNNYNLVGSQLSSQGLFTAYVGDASWDNYAVEFDMKKLSYSAYFFGVFIRRQSDTDYMSLGFNSWNGCHSKWSIIKGGKQTVVVDSEIPHDKCDGHYRIEVDGNRYKLFKDGSPVFVFNNNAFANGGVALISVKDEVNFTIDKFKVVSLRR